MDSAKRNFYIDGTKCSTQNNRVKLQERRDGKLYLVYKAWGEVNVGSRTGKFRYIMNKNMVY
jgi:hypothetical protein